MSFKPDYAITCFVKASPRMLISIYDFCLSSLSILGPGQYTTMVEMLYAGEMHEISLDFDETHLARILSKTPEQLRIYITAQLVADLATPRTIDFNGEVRFGVRARLGKIQ